MRFDRYWTTEARPRPHIRETTTTFKYGDSMMRIRGVIPPYISPTSWWCLVDTSRRGWCWWVWRLISWSDLANRPTASLLLLDVDEECKWNGVDWLGGCRDIDCPWRGISPWLRRVIFLSQRWAPKFGHGGWFWLLLGAKHVDTVPSISCTKWRTRDEWWVVSEQ